MNEQDNEKPPLFKSWRNWYALVLGFLLVQIIVYFYFTTIFG